MADKLENELDTGLQPPGGEKDGAAMSTTAVTIDWDLYASYLEESDLSDEQKRDFIETLWGIVLAFVDLGFGVHPVQQACEQTPAVAGTATRENHENALILSPDLLSSLEDIPNIKKQMPAGNAVHFPADKEES